MRLHGLGPHKRIQLLPRHARALQEETKLPRDALGITWRNQRERRVGAVLVVVGVLARHLQQPRARFPLLGGLQRVLRGLAHRVLHRVVPAQARADNVLQRVLRKPQVNEPHRELGHPHDDVAVVDVQVREAVGPQDLVAAGHQLQEPARHVPLKLRGLLRRAREPGIRDAAQDGGQGLAAVFLVHQGEGPGAGRGGKLCLNRVRVQLDRPGALQLHGQALQIVQDGHKVLADFFIASVDGKHPEHPRHHEPLRVEGVHGTRGVKLVRAAGVSPDDGDDVVGVDAGFGNVFEGGAVAGQAAEHNLGHAKGRRVVGDNVARLPGLGVRALEVGVGQQRAVARREHAGEGHGVGWRLAMRGNHSVYIIADAMASGGRLEGCICTQTDSRQSH